MSKMKETLSEYPEYIIVDSYPDYNPEEGWIYGTMSDVEEIIKKHGVEFFIEKLPRYAKIAIISQLRNKNVNSG